MIKKWMWVVYYLSWQLVDAVSFVHYHLGRVNGVRIKDIPVVPRNADDIYGFPVIVYWEKGEEGHHWYKGELLCLQYPNGEVTEIADSVESLAEQLRWRYVEMHLGYY